ncbi:hypothetical protein [Couchioplanes azureus]|uniref:hypothetical protein n=1 Tax=Couchioplanes caeruleus TaxID=56438 RepID=UPI001670A14C|nr:hypothetical protein [Couchioplanes caeruleus]GGQ60249.1 hypothetical protein GCM10010166_32330 [Couchioplanes caeruleus subsp. azureus]
MVVQETEERPGADAAAPGRSRRARAVATVVAAAGVLGGVFAVLSFVRDLGDITVDDVEHAWCSVWSCSADDPVPPAPTVSGSPQPVVPAPSALTKPAPTGLTASFSVPRDGNDVPLCTPVRGTVSGLTPGRAAWLLVKGPGTGDLYYLTRKIIPTSRGSGDWDLESQQIGRPADKGNTFHMLIIGTEGDATDEYVRAFAEQRNYVRLPATYRTLDDIAVTIADSRGC